MKIKLDENLGFRTYHLFESNDFDVKTVAMEGICGCRDEDIFRICIDESRCLVTLDMDFSDIIRFNPINTSGIAVIKTYHNLLLPSLEKIIQNFINNLKLYPIENQLWIVEPNRIRIYPE
ncbi:MAG: hypothetical protein QG635_2470 [Bacteroidota bacterium]|nr:hypothetical protein [Bacteroidota bacterium]